MKAPRTMIPPTAAPTPMPATAPVLSPLLFEADDGDGVVDVDAVVLGGVDDVFEEVTEDVVVGEAI